MEKETKYRFIEDGDFIVFEDGRIFKRLDPPVSSSGYKFVRVGEKSYPLHRVIASAFIPNPEDKPQVNHIDGNKTNNAVSNLEWVTHQENVQHAVKLGLRGSKKSLVEKQKPPFSVLASAAKTDDALSFAQRTKIALVERNMTQTDLCNAVSEKTGLYCDHSLLLRIFNGRLPGIKVKKAVCEILGISDSP